LKLKVIQVTFLASTFFHLFLMGVTVSTNENISEGSIFNITIIFSAKMGLQWLKTWKTAGFDEQTRDATQSRDHVTETQKMNLSFS